MMDASRIAWQELSFRAADGVRIGYRRAGPAGSPQAPLMLLHGAASNGTRWWHLASHSRLREERVLLFPDLRGHGLSLWRGRVDMERWSDDLAQLLQATGHRRAIVGGHCLGANLAVHFAVRHPGLCAGLVLIEPMAPEALLGSMARLRPYQPLLRLALALARGVNRLGIHRRRLQALDLEQLDRSVWLAPSAAAGEQAMRRRYASPWHDLQTLPTAQYLANLREVLRPLPFAQVRCPTLGILSTGRLMADPVRTRAALVAIPGVEIVELPAQHWIPTEQPQALCDLVDTWVTRLPAMVAGAAGP
ncbi:MAG: alpha/beta hydrolase [Gammaproteobacteria bacterium]|nr:MAG: alpha/beta hydrolase [Gammaproteobacteria bacterium]